MGLVVGAQVAVLAQLLCHAYLVSLSDAQGEIQLTYLIVIRSATCARISDIDNSSVH